MDVYRNKNWEETTTPEQHTGNLGLIITLEMPHNNIPTYDTDVKNARVTRKLVDRYIDQDREHYEVLRAYVGINKNLTDLIQHHLMPELERRNVPTDPTTVDWVCNYLDTIIIPPAPNLAHASEPSLAREWLTPLEDEAWKHL